MDTTTIIVIIAVVLMLGFYLYNRSRPAQRGTYDDKNARSSGSIGGGTRANDDPEVRSSGSIGGGTRAHNSPQQRSGGSIGGGPASRPPREEVEERPAARPSIREDIERRDRVEPLRDNGVRTLPPLDLDNDNVTADRDNEDRLVRERAERQRKDNEDFKSGGSIGGSSR